MDSSFKQIRKSSGRKSDGDRKVKTIKDAKTGSTRKLPTEKSKTKKFSAHSKYDAQAVSVLNQIIAFTDGVSSRIQHNDKTPNTDGNVDLFDTKGIVLGQIEVQVKSLPADGKKQFSCPTYLIDYGKRTPTPFLLICVDRQLKIAYWKELTEDIPGYKPSQDFFTIYFDDDDLIVEKGNFVERWKKLAKERVNLPNEVKRLRAKASLLENIDESSLIPLQIYTGIINAEFDAHWSRLKELLFPTLASFGVILNSHSQQENSWIFQVCSIRKGNHVPTITAGYIDWKNSVNDQFGRELFSHRFSRIFDPIKDGFAFVKSIVERVTFLPESENCSIEIVWAAYKLFPSIEQKEIKNSLDVKKLLKFLTSIDWGDLKIPDFFLADYMKLRERGIVACHHLLSLNQVRVKSLYLGTGQPIANYTGQSPKYLLSNLKKILKMLLQEYNQYLRLHELRFLGDRWFNESQAVVFVTRSLPDGSVTYDEFFLEYDGKGARIRVVDELQIDKAKLFHERPLIKINGKQFKVLGYKNRFAPMQVYEHTPLNDMLSELLKDDLENYFSEAISNRKKRKH